MLNHVLSKRLLTRVIHQRYHSTIGIVSKDDVLKAFKDDTVTVIDVRQPEEIQVRMHRDKNYLMNDTIDIWTTIGDNKKYSTS